MKTSNQVRKKVNSRKSHKTQAFSANSNPQTNRLKDPPQIENGVVVYRSMSALFDTWLNSIPRGINPRAGVEIGLVLTLSVGEWTNVAQAASQENMSIRAFLERIISSEAIDYVNGDRPPLAWGPLSSFSRAEIEDDKVFNAFVDFHDLRGRFKEKTIGALFREWRHRHVTTKEGRSDFMRDWNFEDDPEHDAIREFLNTPPAPERVPR